MPKRKATSKKAETLDEETLNGKTVADLRQLCTDRGLDTKGAKKALVQRILDHEDGGELFNNV